MIQLKRDPHGKNIRSGPSQPGMPDTTNSFSDIVAAYERKIKELEEKLRTHDKHVRSNIQGIIQITAVVTCKELGFMKQIARLQNWYITSFPPLTLYYYAATQQHC